MKLFSLFLGCLLLALPDVKAVLMRPLAIDELTHKADLIVQGTVLGKTSQRDDAGRIYTRVDVRVTEIWKGKLPAHATTNSLTIVQSGGTVGDVREEVSGNVEYAIGEEFVAFLVFNARGEPVTIGLSQGKFHVWRDGPSGEKFAQNPFHGAPESSVTAGEAHRPPLPVRELKQEVQKAGR